jgi:hypothetical protein
MTPKGEIAPKTVVICALVVGASTIAFSPFFDQAICPLQINEECCFINKNAIALKI